MTYYIFLKSLTSIEEFRKNPHVKIPPKSPCANFQSLGKFKNPILIRKLFFLISARPPPLFFFQPSHGPPPFPPVRPSRTELVRFLHFKTCPILQLVRFGLKTGPIRSLRPQAAARALGPSHVGVFTERRILFDFVHSGRDTFSLSHHCHVGPACQLHPLPPPPANRCH
jgi:hypothetical protein